MTKQDALNYIREHLTTLHSNPNIYDDGTCNIICALEDVVVPMLEVGIANERLLEDIYDKHSHAFDRVNIISSDELKRALELYDKEVT